MYDKRSAPLRTPRDVHDGADYTADIRRCNIDGCAWAWRLALAVPAPHRLAVPRQTTWPLHDCADGAAVAPAPVSCRGGTPSPLPGQKHSTAPLPYDAAQSAGVPPSFLDPTDAHRSPRT